MPLSWLPAVVCAASYAIFAAVMSTVASRHYDWLIPSQPVRLVGACMFCLLPGLNEMAGNLCNLNWILFCWLALVALKDPSQPFALTELGLTVLVTVSTGTAILLVPLFSWRLATSLQHSRPARVSTRNALQLAIVLLCGVGLPAVFASDRLGPSPITSSLDVVSLWYDHLARLTALTPWIGDRLTYQFSEGFPAGAYLAAKLAFAGFLIGWAWVRRHDSRAQAILLFLIGVSGWTVLAVFSRPYALELLLREHGDGLDLNRYSFIMSFAALLFWLVVLTPSPPSRSRPVAAACLMVFVVLNLTLPLYRFDIAAYGKDRRWLASAGSLEQSIRTGCPRVVTVRQYPDGWQFSYTSPTPAAVCP